MFSHDVISTISRQTEKMVIWDEILHNVLKSPWQYFCGWRQNSNFLAGFLFSHGAWRAGSALRSSSCRFPGFLPRLQKSQLSFENRFWTPGPGSSQSCALHSIIATGRLELSWPRMRFSVNQSRQSLLFQEIIIINLLLTINYKHSKVKDSYRRSSPVETPMVSLILGCFSGPGYYWIISGYCVRVGLLK